MLSMLLVLAAGPQSAMPVMPDALSAPSPQPGARMRVMGQTPELCRSEVLRANDPVSANGGLMWRDAGQAVGLYLLLERRVNGCPAPIVVNYRVPGSNAVGRELGRDPGPLPSLAPRP